MISYDGPRFLTSFNLAGTKSFRLSASMLFNYYGNNAQNINKDSSEIFISDPDTSFVQIDQSGAEALIVAYDAPKGRLRELFDLGVKSHFYVCLLLFIKDWKNKVEDIDYLKLKPAELVARPEWPALCKEMKENKANYDTAKTCCHSANYGTAARKYQVTVLKLSRGRIKLTYQEAEHYLGFYHALLPEIRMWHGQIEGEIKNTRVLRNFFGYPRRFEGLLNDSYMREAYSWIPQSTVGCITHQATIELNDYIQKEKKPWHIMNNKHDSYLLQVPDSEVEEAKAIGIKFMARKLVNRTGEEFQMKAEATVGKNWKL